MKPSRPVLQSTRLFDQVREWIRCHDYIVKIKTIFIFIMFLVAIAPLRPAINDTSVRWGVAYAEEF